VKYDTAEAFRAALDQRIRNEATTTGLPVMRLRKRVAFERFLARLAVAEPGSWVLKGAFALELRLGVRTRMTKDIDLAGADNETHRRAGDRPPRPLQLRPSCPAHRPSEHLKDS
jgi:hypothetical protein